MDQVGFKSGFVAIIGRPNVGKSTLLNTILSQKLSIISPKPQTTRNRILGIRTDEQAQIIFLDTPGIHRAKSKLNKYMVKTALKTLEDVDLILVVVDETVGDATEDDYDYLFSSLRKVKTPSFLLINKIDLMADERLSFLRNVYSTYHTFTEILPISALRGDNVELLIEKIAEWLPEGPHYFPDDEVTDQPERFIIAELIREKVINFTHQEIPYKTAVIVEEMKEGARGVMVIDATIYVERDSQKGIMIGSGGGMLKKIGQTAREEIEALLGSKVYLTLWTRVKKNWTENDQYLRDLGYRL